MPHPSPCRALRELDEQRGQTSAGQTTSGILLPLPYFRFRTGSWKAVRTSVRQNAVTEHYDNYHELEATFFTDNGWPALSHSDIVVRLAAFLWTLPTLFSSLPSSVGSFITFPNSSLALPFAL